MTEEVQLTLQLSKPSAPPPAGYHVFSIRPRDTGTGGAFDVSDPYTKRYITRKSHRKSRLGCLPCKAKRVKCDEKQPECGRCQRTKSDCSYSPQKQQSKTKEPEDRDEDVKEENESLALTPVTSASSSERSISVTIPGIMDHPSRDTHLLKHYETITGLDRDTVTCSDILVGSMSQKYRTSVLRIAQEHPFLLHAILSVAALHLELFEVPGYRVAKLSHLQVALTDFQSAINRPITKCEADAILLTSMMINMQYFASIDSMDPKDSWVFSSNPRRLDWLSTQMGLLPLIVGTQQFRTESLLLPVSIAAIYENDEKQGLPAELLQLCGIHSSMTRLEKEANPYFHSLQLIAPLMLLEHGPNNLVKYMKCVSNFNRPFYNLLRLNDHLALLILGYWFGLMCHVDFWWIQPRVQRDCTAICMFLEANGSELVQYLLGAPASACRYTLRARKGKAPPIGRMSSAGVVPSSLDLLIPVSEAVPHRHVHEEEGLS